MSDPMWFVKDCLYTLRDYLTEAGFDDQSNVDKAEEELEHQRLREVALELRVERLEVVLKEAINPVPQSDEYGGCWWCGGPPDGHASTCLVTMALVALEREGAAPGLEGEGT